MMLFKPKARFDKVTDIGIDFLKEHDIKGIILDVDNTLINYNKELLEGAKEWCKELREKGINVPENVELHKPYLDPIHLRCPECGKEVSDRAGACPVCGFPIAAQKNFGKIRIRLGMHNRTGGIQSVEILANNAILVTHNTDEFSRVIGLKIEDWRQ